MRSKVLSLDFMGFDLAMPQDTNGLTNKETIARMKKFLTYAINTELTAKQRYCICQRYFEHKKVKDIAADLHVSPSGVTRHIQRGIVILRRTSGYFL